MIMKKWSRTRLSIWITTCQQSSFAKVKNTRKLRDVDDIQVAKIIYFITVDAQDLIQGILKEDPNERLSIEQILNHPWWMPRSDDDDDEEAKDEQEGVQIIQIGSSFSQQQIDFLYRWLWKVA